MAGLSYKEELKGKSNLELIPLGQWAAAELRRKDNLPDSTLEECLLIEREFIRRGLTGLWQALWNT